MRARHAIAAASWKRRDCFAPLEEISRHSPHVRPWIEHGRKESVRACWTSFSQGGGCIEPHPPLFISHRSCQAGHRVRTPKQAECLGSLAAHFPPAVSQALIQNRDEPGITYR